MANVVGLSPDHRGRLQAILDRQAIMHRFIGSTPGRPEYHVLGLARELLANHFVYLTTDEAIILATNWVNEHTTGEGN